MQSSRPAEAARFDRPLLLSPGKDLRGYVFNKLGRAFLFLVTFVSVIAVLLIFYFIIREAAGFLASPFVKQFFTGTGWYPEAHEHPEFGVLAIVAGTIYVTAIALLIAVPLGLLAAVWLSDIATFRVRQFIKPVIEILAAIPSVEGGLVVHLSEVTYIDSSGVATLVEGLRSARRHGTGFALMAPSPAVMQVLELARLDSVFEVR